LLPVQQALKKLLLADQRVQVMSNITRMKCFCINSSAHLTMTIVVITDSTAEPPIQPTTRTLHIIEYKLALWKNGAGLWPFKVVLVDAPSNHTTTFVCDSSNALYYLNKKADVVVRTRRTTTYFGGGSRWEGVQRSMLMVACKVWG
jgi:hypothetical protein